MSKFSSADAVLRKEKTTSPPKLLTFLSIRHQIFNNPIADFPPLPPNNPYFWLILFRYYIHTYMFSSLKKTDEKEKTPQPPCYFYTHHWTYLETKYTSSTKISTFVTFTMNWNIEHIFWKIYSKDHINTGFLTEVITARAYWEKKIFELLTAKS